MYFEYRSPNPFRIDARPGSPGVKPGGVGRPVAVCDDVADARVGLGCSHDRIDRGLPAAPGVARVGLRIRDEPHPARIEPAPVLTAATGRRCAHGGLRVRELEPALVVPQVVDGGFPFMVSPGRHVRGGLAPRHDVVEVLIDRRLAVVVRVGQITRSEHERRVVRGDLTLRGRDLGGRGRTSDVGNQVEAEGSVGSGRERVVGATADRVVVGRAASQTGQLDLLERTG